MRLLCIIIVMITSGCSQISETDYFPPLNKGEQREYDEFVFSRGEVERKRMIIRGEGTEVLFGTEYIRYAIASVGEDGRLESGWVEYYRKAPEGWYTRITTDVTVNEEALTTPLPVTVGMSWTVKLGVWEAEYTAEAIEDVVLASATYRNCLKMKISYKGESALAPGALLTGTYWFAPGLGLIKAVYQQGSAQRTELTLVTSE